MNFIIVTDKLNLFAKKSEMNRICFSLLIVIGVLFTSCIPSKQLIYLQSKDENDSTRVIKPIVFKSYRL
jgi:polysaccharide export outer membrane protein